MSNTIKGFRGKDGPIWLDYGGVANIPGAVKSITELEAAVGDHFEVASVDDSGRVATVKAVAKPTGGGELPADPTFDSLQLGGETGVSLYPEGTATAPALTLYGTHGDDPVQLNNVADATDDRSVPNLGQVKRLIGSGENSGENPSQGGMSADLKTALIDYYTHVVPQFDDTNGLAYINAVLTALGAETRGESGGSGGEEVPDEPDQPGGGDSGGAVGGNEIVLSDLEWVDGKTLTGGGEWVDHVSKSVSAAVDVSGVTLVKIVVAESQIAFASAPFLSKVPDTESIAGNTLIRNNEGANYIGATYAFELSFDVSAADYIRFVCDTNCIVNLTATLETEVS